MILIDTGPLIALLNRSDTDHLRCTEALATLTAPMITSWPAVTEAMHLIRARDGRSGQGALWRLLESEAVQIADLTPQMIRRTRSLMEKYADLPMDFADATLVAIAEEHHLARVFTLDRDFAIYRLRGRQHFTIVPG